MKVIMQVDVIIRKEDLIKSLRKELDTELYPAPGMVIQDSAFGIAQTPVLVCCDFDRNCYFIEIPSIYFDTEANWKSEEEGYRIRGWKELNGNRSKV